SKPHQKRPNHQAIILRQTGTKPNWQSRRSFPSRNVSLSGGSIRLQTIGRSRKSLKTKTSFVCPRVRCIAFGLGHVKPVKRLDLPSIRLLRRDQRKSIRLYRQLPKRLMKFGGASRNLGGDLSQAKRLPKNFSMIATNLY